MQKTSEMPGTDVLQVCQQRSYLRCITQGVHYVADHQGGLMRILWLSILVQAIVCGLVGMLCIGYPQWVTLTVAMLCVLASVLYWAYMGVILRRVVELGYIPRLHPWQLVRQLPMGLMWYVPARNNVRPLLRLLPTSLLIRCMGWLLTECIELVASLPALYITYLAQMSHEAHLQGDVTEVPSYLPMLQFIAYFLATLISGVAQPLWVFPLLLQWGRSKAVNTSMDVN